MSDTPTPRIDAMRKHVFGEHVWVTVEECKALETDLAAHREALRVAQESIGHLIHSAEDVTLPSEAAIHKARTALARIQSILKTPQAEERE